MLGGICFLFVIYIFLQPGFLIFFTGVRYRFLCGRFTTRFLCLLVFLVTCLVFLWRLSWRICVIIFSELLCFVNVLVGLLKPSLSSSVLLYYLTFSTFSPYFQVNYDLSSISPWFKSAKNLLPQQRNQNNNSNFYIHFKFIYRFITKVTIQWIFSEYLV